MTLDSGPLPNTFPPSVKDPQAPGTYPIWYPACVDRLLLRSRDLCTAYLSNHLSDKSRVRLPSAPIVRQFRTPAHRRTQCCRQTPAELISTLQLRRVDSAYSRRRAVASVAIQDMPQDHQGGTLHGTPHANRTKPMPSCSDDFVGTVAAQQETGMCKVTSMNSLRG
jgi:hypothetical protein